MKIWIADGSVCFVAGIHGSGPVLIIAGSVGRVDIVPALWFV
jgi:hypothetical protein